MKQDYSRDAVQQYLINNLDIVLDNPTMYGCIVERMSAEYDGDTFVDGDGYDQQNESTGVRKEVKSTNSPQGGGPRFRINVGDAKYGSFDILKIIDTCNNRVFEVPHDVFYNERSCTGNEFHWSASYGKNDARGVKVENTQMLLRYEVI